MNSFFVNILCEIHLNQSTSNPPTFTFNTDFTANELNKDKIMEAIKDKNSFIQFSKLCIGKFSEKYPTELYGSVQCNPFAWTNLALSVIYKTCQENNPMAKIIFPNGCCTMIDCTINRYYLIVLNELLLTNI